MKLPPCLNAARSRWRTLATVTAAHRQGGEAARALVAEAYAQTPAYNYQLQFDQLRARIRQFEADLGAEHATTLKLGCQLDQ